MKKFLNSGLAVLLMFVMASCGESTSSGGGVCTDVYSYGVVVAVTDVDGDVLADNDDDGVIDETVTVTLVDGDYTEELDYFDDGFYMGAGEREGTYTLIVEVDGVEIHTEEVEVTVDDSGCHVVTEEITVELERDE